ncbi:MAG: DUF1843 domain-containing protein [Pyrinomonadaceae bacterium]|nr:DUF1843 domain-containing protein [Pyrinomonadaceae bacterium]
MATRKTTTKSTRKSASASRTSGAAAAIRSGALPPYGVPIRAAIARGDQREMQAIGAATRQHLKNVQSALAKLEGALGKKR